MEVSGSAIRQSAGFRCHGTVESYPFSGNSRSRVGARQRATISVRRWSDEGHSLYYASSPRCSGFRDTQIKEVKKIAAIGSELSRELAALYSTALGMDSEEVIGGDLRGKMIMEKSELLLAQLNQKKTREKEMKKRKKVEMAALKGRKMRDCADESSSSSSSESSDSDGKCEDVVDMNKQTEKLEELMTERLVVSVDQLPECKQEQQFTEIKTDEKAGLNHTTMKLNHMSSAAVSSCISSSSSVVVTKPLDKIEVCMGGKCKKSGAIELLQELEKKVGIEGAVIGCKCMGKCKLGPNVRVLNHSSSLKEDEFAKILKKPMHIGVGLDDVSDIVANFLGLNDKDMDLLAAEEAYAHWCWFRCCSSKCFLRPLLLFSIHHCCQQHG